MGIISVAFLYIFLLAISIMTGFIILADKKEVIGQICYGFALHIAIFEAIALPCVFFNTSFSVLFGLYMAVLIVTIGAFAYCVAKRKNNIDIRHWVKSFFGDFFRNVSPLLILLILMVGFQACLASWLWHTDADDGYYTTISTIACLENRIEISSDAVYNGYGGGTARGSIFCWELFIAAVSKLFHIHPAIVDHTVIIGFLIAVSYMAVYMIGKSLFPSIEEKRRRDAFLLLYAFLVLFSGYSTYAIGCRMLLRIWQGKNLLACFLLPLFLHSIIEVYKGDYSWRRWIINLGLVVSGIGMTIIGIYFMPITYAIYGIPLLIYLIAARNFKNLGLIIKRLLISVIPVVIGMGFTFFNVSGSGTEGTSSSYAGANALEVYKLTVGESAIPVVFIVSLLVIFIEVRVRKKNTLIRLLFIFIPVLMFATFLNPLLSVWVSKHITGVPVYWRLYWIIPLQITIAIAMSVVFEIKKNEWLSYLLGAVMVGVIVLSGSNIAKKDAYFSAHQNFYKIPQEVINVTEVLLEKSGVLTNDIGASQEDGSDIPSETVRCAFPTEISYYARQYDSRIGVIRPREFQGSNTLVGETDRTYWWLYDSIYLNNNLDDEEVRSVIREAGIDYIYIPGEKRADAEGYEAIMVDGCGYLYAVE